MPETFNLTAGKENISTVLSSSNTAPGAVVGNLLKAQPGENCGFLSGAGFVVLDMGAVVSLRQVVVLYTSLAGADTIRVRCSTNADGVTSPLFDSTASAIDAQGLARPSGYRHWIYHHLAGVVSARYIRIDFSTAAAFTVGRVFATNPLQLEYNPDFGSTSWGYDEAEEGEILDSGVEVLVERFAAPQLNFTATWVTQTEMDAGWEELGRLQHEGVPVLVVRRPDVHAGRHNAIYYGRLRMVPIVAAEFDMFEVQGRIRSMV